MAQAMASMYTTNNDPADRTSAQNLLWTSPICVRENYIKCPKGLMVHSTPASHAAIARALGMNKKTATNYNTE